MKHVKYSILIALIITQGIFGQIANFAYGDYLNCGNSNPQQYSDCSISDLNTGFRCCYLTQVPGKTNPICALLSDTARQIYKPEKGYVGPPYFNCGNSASHAKFSIYLIILLVIWFIL